MKRSATVLLGVMVLACAAPAWLLAQSALERLESQIRGRVATPDNQGVNRQPGKVSRTAAAQTARQEVTELGYLGLTADDANDRGRGARVLDIQPGGPAEQAGLRRQDLITAIATVRVRQLSDMSEVLSTFGPGQKLDFDVLRDGKPQRVQVTLGRRPTGTTVRSQSTGEAPEAVPLPEGEAIPEPPALEITEPTLAPPKGAEPALTTAARLDALERRIDALERRIKELEIRDQRSEIRD